MELFAKRGPEGNFSVEAANTVIGNDLLAYTRPG
jgi:hypothetical protein